MPQNGKRKMKPSDAFSNLEPELLYEVHPFMDFLEARKKCVDWFDKQGKSDAWIAKQLSMDEEQVKLIREPYQL